MKQFFLFFFLLPLFCFSQTDNTVQKSHYSNGNLKSISIQHGEDTVEMRKYYRNGQLKDSLWIYISGRDEITFGTEKTYYDNGRLASVTRHGSNWNEYTQCDYYKNGRLERIVQNPAGPSKFYNKKGKQKGHHEASVPKQYRKHRHLLGTTYNVRITTNKATLTLGKKKKSIKAGVLVSLYMRGDTSLFNHCQVEGFSQDSIYISKFEYDPKYGQEAGKDILKYKETLALGFNQLDSIYYSKHNNSLTSATSLATTVVGTLILIVPIITLPSMIKGNIEGDIEPKETLVFCGSYAGVGAVVIYLGECISQTMVPKKYDMHNWKIAVKK